MDEQFENISHYCFEEKLVLAGKKDQSLKELVFQKEQFWWVVTIPALHNSVSVACEP